MKNNSLIRTSIVGLGRIGWLYHLPEIIKHKGFDLVAVVDNLQERLDEAEDVYKVKGYVDYEEMLCREKPDLVVIASPTSFHYEQIRIAFKYGCDVLCEKPVTVLLEELDKVMSIAQKNNLKIMTYQPHRCNREIVSLRHILSLNLLGPIYMIKRCCVDYNRRSDWQAFQKNGGGMLNNYGSHFIDQLMHIASFSELRNLQCITKKIASLGDANDVVKILMETESGMIFDLDINMASALSMPGWQIFGRYGSAILELGSDVWKAKYFYQEDLDDVATQLSLAASGRSYSNGEIIPWRLAEFKLSDFDEINFYDCCYEYFGCGKEPFIPIHETRRVLEIIEQCRKMSCDNLEINRIASLL